MNAIKEVYDLRCMGKHFRDVGLHQLSHASFRAARQHVRDIRILHASPGAHGCSSVVSCYCKECI